MCWLFLPCPAPELEELMVAMESETGLFWNAGSAWLLYVLWYHCSSCFIPFCLYLLIILNFPLSDLFVSPLPIWWDLNYYNPRQFCFELAKNVLLHPWIDILLFILLLPFYFFHLLYCSYILPNSSVPSTKPIVRTSECASKRNLSFILPTLQFFLNVFGITLSKAN